MIVASISSERRERSVNQFVKTTSLTEVPTAEEQKKPTGDDRWAWLFYPLCGNWKLPTE